MKTMSDYTIYCTKEQTHKAIELGANITWCEKERKVNNPTLHEKGKSYKYFIPTAEQMIGWLEGKGFRFEVDCCTMYCLMVHINNAYICTPICASSRKEATLAAIDVALEYLINNEI